ncbi:hypothetical protein FOZ62_015200, partial [Perkinsus olseni]
MTEVREPQPQKSSGGRLSIFAPAAPTPVAEPEAPKPVVPSFPPPTPTASPPRPPVPATPAELPPPAAAPPPLPPPAPVMVSPPRSIIRDECEVFSDDELE